MKSVRATSTWLAVAALGLALAACLSLEKSYPEKQLYVLDPTRAGANAAPVAGTILKVRGLRISPQYEGKGFVYRHEADRYEADFYQEFFIAPAPMITECVRRWLADARLFESVVDASSQVSATHVLEGSVKALYADVSGASPAAVLELQLFLLDDTGDHSRIAYQETVAKRIALADRSGPAIVAGWNQALREILAQVEEGLRSAVASTVRKANE